LISVPLILEKLKIADMKAINTSNRNYSAIIRNANIANFANDHIINVVTAEELSSSPSKMRGACFVIGNQFPIDNLEGIETVVFPKDTQIDDLITQANQVITEFERYQKYIMKINETAAKNNNLLEIFDVFAEYCNNLVILGDCSGNIILKANANEKLALLEETLESNMKQGYVPYDSSYQSGRLQARAKILSSSEPVLSYERFASKHTRMAYRVRGYDGQFEHYLSIFEVYNPYGYFDIDLLKYTADLISYTLPAKIRLQIEAPCDYVLESLINGSLSDQKSLDNRMKNCRMTTSDYYMITYIRILNSETVSNEDNLDRTNQLSVKNTINKLFPSLINIMYDNGILLLLQASSREEINDKVNSIKEYLENSNLIIGHSRIYGNLMETQKKYEEAKLATEVGSKIYFNRREFTFQELYFEIMIVLTNEQTSIDKFIVDGLLQLKELDKIGNTEYFNTLYEYLLCGTNINELSRKLFIHRNTALYRINKAKEVLNVDITNGDYLFQLYLSFKCIQVLDALDIKSIQQ